MERIGSGQTNRVTIKKPKKKQNINSESDRQKQAEKKKRRLEKALATSAAIISELEKKKQKKKEQELERLDQEGAQIAESVALHVLEDSNEAHLGPLRPMRPVWGDWAGGVQFDCTGDVQFDWNGGVQLPVWGVDLDFEFCPAKGVSSLQIREEGLQEGNSEFNLLKGV